jgi:hypothetical protein
MELNEPVPFAKVENSINVQLKTQYKFLASCVLARDFDRAVYFAESIQRFDQLLVDIQIVYNTRQMTFGEIVKASQEMKVEFDPYDGPRPDIWERLLAEVGEE